MEGKMTRTKDRKEDCVLGELGIRTVLVSGGPEPGAGAAPGAGVPPQLASRFADLELQQRHVADTELGGREAQGISRQAGN